MELTPRAVVTLAGRQVELVASLRAMLTFEELLGFALHATMGRNPAKVGRALLWAMATAGHVPAPSLADIGRMATSDLNEALVVAVGLLQAGAPILDDYEKETAAGDGAAADARSRTDWMELWATGRRDLGLTEEELWSCSPAMYWALLRRYEAALEHAELCAGIGAAAVQECHRDQTKAAEPISPWLFVLRGRRAAEVRKETERKLITPVSNLKEKIRSFFRRPAELVANGKAKRARGVRIKIKPLPAPPAAGAAGSATSGREGQE